ncbi:MAG: Ig-like domain-containing protein [Hormoscilla sp.]
MKHETPDMGTTQASLRDRHQGPTFITNVGDVTSQGDRALRADDARSDFGVDGTGITIGVLSDSYDNLGGAADDVESGDLPEGVTVLRDLLSRDEAFPGNDEGRAMLQLIYDLAPGADLIFRTAGLGSADFADGIDELVAAGADIIVDDIAYFDQPFFQDGIIAQAADRAAAAGVAYFSAVGNAGNNSYESSFNPGTTYEEGDFPVNIFPGNFFGQVDSFFGGTAHEFTPGNEFQEFTLGPSDEIVISFQWDDPFFSVSGGDGSTRDLDIYVFNEDRTEVVGGAASANLGQDALERLSFFNGTEETQTFNLTIVHDKSVGSDVDPDLIKYIDFGDRANFTEQSLINSSTSFGHPNAAGAAGVGAANFSDTPEFGVNPPELGDFSSLGGTPILFDTEGNRLPTPEIRNQPLFVAPDGTATTVPGFETFRGTSAAAPHAAAVAALMLEAAGGPGSLSPQQIYSVLSETAIDMETPGFDFASGFGLIDGSAAVAAVLGEPVDPPEPPPPPNSPPMARRDSAASLRNQPVAIDLLANDIDPDGDRIQLVSFESPTNGTLRLLDNGTPSDTTDDRLLYRPNPGFLGIDSFRYSISDGRGEDNSIVRVRVLERRRTSTADALPGTTRIGASREGQLVPNSITPVSYLGASEAIERILGYNMELISPSIGDVIF